MRKNRLIVITALCYSLFAWLVYAGIGPYVVKAAYSAGILNRITHWQSPHPLEYYREGVDQLLRTFLFIIPAIVSVFFLILWYSARKGSLAQHTAAIDAIPDSLVGLGIMAAAGLCLYTELMVIRLHSSFFQLFAYFKNVSLLSCFLGLGIGYALGSRRPLTTPLAWPCLMMQIIALHILRFNPIKYFLQNPISEQLTLGLQQSSGIHIIFVYIFLAIVFFFNALCFVPLGQLTSRLMRRRPNLVAYSWNLVGSLLGIFLFSFVSFIWAPPAVWIILASAALLPFLYREPRSLFLSVAAAALAMICLLLPVRLDRFDIYSPYQILTLTLSKDEPPALCTNNIYYQKILDLREEVIRDTPQLNRWSEYYMLPYLFKPRPQRVLIVGSGTGNDIAAALHNGASEIDAVEIDPAIFQCGKQLHPEAPYSAPGVRPIITDARAFIQHTDKKYDLIVYGLLDSHTLLSGMSGGIRLDSYVYTVQGFREARAKLKRGGILSLTFSLMGKEMGRKLFLMLQEAFDGKTPLVYMTGYDGSSTFLAGDVLQKPSPEFSSTVLNMTEAFSDRSIRADISTDDWPFFYMPVRRYPVSYVVLLCVLFALSLLFIRQFPLLKSGGFSAVCFFLGSGFMLLETKGITELALFYGSTWIVISAVTGAILLMAFLANALLMRIRTPAPLLIYGLTAASLCAGWAFTFLAPHTVPGWVLQFGMPLLLTLPLFFSGMAFSGELKLISPEKAISSNLLGAMLGGFLEYNSMYFGFRSLYLLALIMYGCAFLCSLQKR